MHATRLALTLTLTLAAAAALPAAGDVIVLTDGRTYEGEIIGQDAVSVRFDTMATPRIRAQLTFHADEIESIEVKPVPAAFFDPPPPEPRVSDDDEFEDGTTLYLEVPVVGAFGTEVFASGIEDVLRYARRYRIKHIVFVIDSDGGGIDEAGKTYDLLKKFDRTMDFHAIIKRCTGDALAIPVWCDTILLLPGAVVGGSEATLGPEDASDDQEALVRSQIAREIARDMERRDRDPSFVKAMIDPSESLSGWRTDDGTIEFGHIPPVGTPEDRIIFRAGAGEILQLDEQQAVALGLPRFDGSAEDLGAQLGIEVWEPESRFGYDAMGKRAADERRRQTEARVKHADAVERNIQRREYAERYIEEALRKAAEWAPDQGDYATYSKRWNWGWGGSYRRSSSTWTQESQREWRNRSDTMLRYLDEAARGIREAAALDKEAIELGLEPTFKPGELGAMADDVRTKYDQVITNRNRRRN